MQPVLTIVVPCYNEEAVLPMTAPRFLEKIEQLVREGKIADQSTVAFVDDGSTDQTWELIQQLAQENRRYQGLKLSRNRGHQNALLAGLMELRKTCDITISIDADGQDDINAMDEMVVAYQDGCEIVYGVRKKRETDTFFKRTTAQGFYKFLHWMGAEVVYNHADYRLVSARALAALADFHEVNLFLRGLFPLVGFKSTAVYYDRHERLAGESHYPLSKMIGLAVDGITSLSVKPLTLITRLGLLVAGLSFLGGLWSVLVVMMGHAVSGWASIVCMLSFLGGIQLISIGVLGEYIGKIYKEVKQRPRYIISDRTNKAE